MSLDASTSLSVINQKRPDNLLIQLGKMKAEIEAMYALIADESNGHTSSTSNPHSVTKSQVGLGNVDNYATATQSEAEAGTATDKFMTPQRSKQAIDKQVKGTSWTQDDGLYIATDEIRARDSGGLILGDDSGQGMLVNDGGIVTNAYQPCWSVFPNEPQINIATGSPVTVVFNNEITDQTGSFASNTFTAPVTGKYQINVNLCLYQVDSAASYIQLQVISSNKTYYKTVSVGQFSGDLVYYNLEWAGIVDMDVSDTVYIAIEQSGGSAQLDIDVHSQFSGYLVA